MLWWVKADLQHNIHPQKQDQLCIPTPGGHRKKDIPSSFLCNLCEEQIWWMVLYCTNPWLLSSIQKQILDVIQTLAKLSFIKQILDKLINCIECFETYCKISPEPISLCFVKKLLCHAINIFIYKGHEIIQLNCCLFITIIIRVSYLHCLFTSGYSLYWHFPYTRYHLLCSHIDMCSFSHLGRCTDTQHWRCSLHCTG